MSGGIEETSASFEARSAPRSYPTGAHGINSEHENLRLPARRFIEEELNPHVDELEQAESFSLHEICKEMGKIGLLGITKPAEYGGSRLDFSFAAVLDEALGYIDCVGVSMAIGVQTEMATPALAPSRF